MRYLTLILLAVSLLLAASAMAETADTPENPLYIRKVEDLPDDFFMGMDVSSVLALEASGVRYYDTDGRERDLFELLAENGVNLIRIRVWNDPYDENGHGYGGGNCDVASAVIIGKRATDAGMRVLIDFHYSDFWADPGKQMVPKAWAGMKIDAKAEALHAWTLDALNQLKAAGVDVAMVQLGNETNGALCGEKVWMKIYKLMNAGSTAVREVLPDALIAVHFANPENSESYLTYASKLDYYSLDYDVFGSSYYPYWHGTLDNLKSVLTAIQQTYGKKVMVLETSYAWTEEDGDFSGNTIGEGGGFEKKYPFTVQGQVNEVIDVAKAMAEIGGIGLCYWEGAWVPVGTESWEKNSTLWETYGSGWATSYAGSYDPKDAGQYYGGCAVDNQTFFDFSGKALPSLAVFRLMRTGNIVPLTVDAVDDVVLSCDIHADLILPETADAVMSDNSRRAVPVVWDPVDAEALKAAGPAKHTIHGTADGRDVNLLLSMVKFNYIRNGDFEASDVSMWRAVDHGGCEQLYQEEKKTDSQSGVMHWHFYSAAAGTVNFDLEQDIEGLPEGTYTYTISVMGGDAGDQEIYSYVRINGEIVAIQPTAITSWNNWFTPVISGIRVAEGDQVTVGLHVRCAGAGAWGKIDDALLNSEGE